MWLDHRRRGRNTRSARREISSWVIAAITPMSDWVLQDYVTAKIRGYRQIQALHAHLVQRCPSLRERL
jgi:hypothetical protein